MNKPVHRLLGPDNSPRVAEYITALLAREGEDYAGVVHNLASTVNLTHNLRKCGVPRLVVDYCGDLLSSLISEILALRQYGPRVEQIKKDSDALLALMAKDIEELRGKRD